jgi:hypothetical protein
MPKLYSNNEIQVPTSNFENLKPRAHVISTLLNYSKALKVNTLKNGKKVVLNLN